jgi:hypothetical protein
MNECRHKWVFQETQRKTNTTYDGNGNYTAHFHRIDVYYCENCCEIKEMEKKQSIELPFGGIRHVGDFAPVWY